MTSKMEDLYRINDVLTALAHEFHVAFVNESDEDTTLDNLTHAIADAFAVGPYRVRPEDEDCDCWLCQIVPAAR
jgi:hypothetical protein